MTENLINDLLDLAKLETNQFTISKEYFNLTSTLYQSIQILHQTAKSKGINLNVDIDKEHNLDLIQSVLGDERRYLQIMLNFLSNSLKFTDNGGEVKISIEVLGHQIDQQDQEDSHNELKRKVINDMISSSDRELKEYMKSARVKN